MKKFLIALIGIIIVVGAVLPFFGNKIAKEELQNHVDVLVSYGLKIENHTESSGYLQTKNHYEFRVDDTQKFMQYITQFVDAQTPPYTDALLEGVLVGLDVVYDNFPFSDAISLDIYPLEFSKEFHESLKKSDATFAEYFENLLKSKGILYHLDYRVLQGEFSGYIKDINEQVTLQKGAQVSFVVDGATYNGQGALIAPNEIATEIKKMFISVKDKDFALDASIDNVTSEASFEAQTSYKATSKIEQLHFMMQEGSYKDATMDAQNSTFEFVSDTKGAKAEFGSNIAMKDFSINSSGQFFAAQDLHFDMLIQGVDKDAYEELRLLLAQLKNDNSFIMQQKVEASMKHLLAQGLEVHLNDFSIADISLNQDKNKGGFKITSNLFLASNPNFVQDLQEAPFRILNTIRLETMLSISKKLFAYINEQLPMSAMALGYAKDEGENYVFDFKYENDALSVNGKPLR